MSPARIENKSLAKMRYFVESCIPCKDAGIPQQGHLVQLTEERDEEKVKKLYYSIEHYERYTSFEEPPETMGAIPLLHSNADYARIRKRLLELKAARDAEGSTE